MNLIEWELLNRRSLKGKSIPNTCNWEQIPITVFKASKPLIIVRLVNPKAPVNWYFGGYLSVFAGSLSTVQIGRYKIPLNEYFLIDTSQEDSSYTLKFWFPWWHQQINIDVYQKDRETDNISDCLEELKKIVTDISETVL